ncbi:MAG: response regulator [Thermosynechococcaceae cyanobacterium]
MYQYLFEPNFSTTTSVTHLSGRGMGLYAVQSQISALKGTVTVKSQLGKGTSFVLRLPLTSTVAKLLVFRIGRRRYALPVNTLAAIAMANDGLVQTHQNQPFFYWKDQFVPILPLSSMAAYHYPLPSLSQEELGRKERPSVLATLEQTATTQFPLLLISRGTQILALKVDEILVERDLVIKPFNNLAIEPPHNLNGCTILGDGSLVPVLDSLALVEKWGQTLQSQPNFPIGSTLSPDLAIPNLPTILVVDDSLTIRNALSSTLRKARYRIFQAKDGWEAFTLWNIDAIVCDIEMPRMTGLELLSRCRQKDPSIPIIMLTYRSSQRYRQLADQLGASAYLTKPHLEKELLDTLAQCLAKKESG